MFNFVKVMIANSELVDQVGRQVIPVSNWIEKRWTDATRVVLPEIDLRPVFVSLLGTDAFALLLTRTRIERLNFRE